MPESSNHYQHPLSHPPGTQPCRSLGSPCAVPPAPQHHGGNHGHTAPSSSLFLQHGSPLLSRRLQAKFGAAAKHTPLAAGSAATSTASCLPSHNHVPPLNFPWCRQLLQGTAQTPESLQLPEAGWQGELVASRREVTTGVGSGTGGATQISQFPVWSHCCLVRRSRFTSQKCQITHFLLLFCPPLPTRSLPHSAQALAVIFTPSVPELQLPFQSFFL